MSTPKLPKDLWKHIRSFSGDTGYEPTPSAKLIKKIHFWVDHGECIFPHYGIDGYVSTVVCSLETKFRKISGYNIIDMLNHRWRLGDHPYSTVSADYLRFVHIDRDGYFIKVSEHHSGYPD